MVMWEQDQALKFLSSFYLIFSFAKPSVSIIFVSVCVTMLSISLDFMFT